MEKLSAHYENRVYYFTINKKEDTKVSIAMYGGDYVLEKSEKGWTNSEKNRFRLAAGLIIAVIKAMELE